MVIFAADYVRDMRTRNTKLQTFLLLALGSEVLYALLAALGDLRPHIPTFLLCFGLLFLLYWFSARLFFGLRSSDTTAEAAPPPAGIGTPAWLGRFLQHVRRQASLSNREVLAVGLTFAVIFRLTLLLTPPSLSDDIYRYVWDGRVASQGINPYQYPPQADELQALQDSQIYPRINHKEVSTIYPPALQLLFAGLYRLAPGVTGFKLAFVLFDLLTALMLLALLKKLGLPPVRVLLYAWNPLVVIEFSGSGHADAFGIFLLSVALWFLVSRRVHLANVFLAFSFLTKLIAALLFPLLVTLRKQARLVLFLAFVLVVAFLYLPYVDAGGQLFHGLKVYSEKWQFNASLFNLVRVGMHALLPQSVVVKYMIEPYGYAADAQTIASRSVDLALWLSKGLMAGIFLGLVVYYWRRLKSDLATRGEIWVFQFGLILFGWFFLLSPTVQPWYLCWLLPFLVVTPNRAWLLLTGLVGLSYWTLAGYTESGVWQESPWVLWLEYVPFYALLILDAVRSRLARGRRLFSRRRELKPA